MAGDVQGKKCPKRNISAGCIPEITCHFSKHIPSEHCILGLYFYKMVCYGFVTSCSSFSEAISDSEHFIEYFFLFL